MFTLLFTFSIGVTFWFLSNHVKFFRKSLKIYGLLFTTLAFTLVMVNLYDTKNIWYPRLETIWAAEKNHVNDAVPVTNITEESIVNLEEPTFIKEEIHLEAPHILQYPELPRGCEVTSLAMLLSYYDYDVDKMKLAEEVKKDPTPYTVKNGKIHFGNPYDGFVGDMYSLTTPGLGVYHGPLVELANQYVKEHHEVVDLTGDSFYKVLEALNNGQPVQVIINAKYKKLPDSAFKTRQTPSGPIDITMSEHSVLVTGYDE